MRGSAGCSTFSRPSILLGVHPLLSASMTRESGGEYAIRVGLRGRRARCSAFLRAAMAEWNGLDVHASVFERRGRQGRYESFSLDADHRPRFSLRLTVDLSRPILGAI